MKHDNLINKMVELDISEKEARIYHALLQKRELTAMEIQEIAHVPRTKVYEITQKMKLNNMCLEKQVGSKKKYQAVDPVKFLNGFMGDKEKELYDQRSIADELKRMAIPVYEQGVKHFDSLENVEIIKDLPSIHERFVNLMKNTKRELIGLAKAPYTHQYDETKLKEQDDAVYGRVKKGIEVKVVYEIPAKDKLEWTYNHIKKCARAGEKARVIESLPINVYIFDERYILMALANATLQNTPLTMFVVDHPPLAYLGKALFDLLWRQAKDYSMLQTLIKR